MKKKILNIDMYLKKKYYQDQHQYYIYRRLKSETFSEESNHRSEKNTSSTLLFKYESIWNQHKKFPKGNNSNKICLDCLEKDCLEV